MPEWTSPARRLRISDATWPPDGRWVAVSWPEADQLVFVRATGPRKIEAAANLSRQFESTSAPRLAGWRPMPSS